MQYRHAIMMSAALLGGIAAPAAAVIPSQIIVFGDSLVDSGNINVAVGGDFFNPVADGYFPGRFTNGPNYNDLLNQRVFGTFQTPSLLGGTNFAFGGARIVNDGDPLPDLALQLGAYLAASGNTADPNALYIINAGAMMCSGCNPVALPMPAPIRPICSLRFRAASRR